LAINALYRFFYFLFKQETYQVRVVDESVYVNTPVELTQSRSKANKQTEMDAFAKNLEMNLNLTEKKESNTLSYWAVKILNTPDPGEKADLTEQVAAKWFNNELADEDIGQVLPPDMPARPASLSIVEPGKIRRGKGGTQSSRIALIHSLANIEQWAIDLSWDIVSRYNHLEFPDGSKLPKEFYSDFIKVARDEAKV
jgi:hypothetical protein